MLAARLEVGAVVAGDPDARRRLERALDEAVRALRDITEAVPG